MGKTGKVLVLHGPNLNLLGERETGIYGTKSLVEINQLMQKEGEQYGLELGFFQSNYEGALVEAIQKAKGNYDVIIINIEIITHTDFDKRW